MDIELMGGPLDGTLMIVADGTRIQVCQQLPLTPAQLIALDEVLPAEPLQELPVVEYAYLVSPDHSPRTGAVLFHYAGVRQRR
jgi:hypothetical protein